MNKTKSDAGKLGAQATHKKRYEMLKELGRYLNKNDLNWLQSKWKTAHIERLLQAYRD